MTCKIIIERIIPGSERLTLPEDVPMSCGKCGQRVGDLVSSKARLEIIVDQFGCPSLAVNCQKCGKHTEPILHGNAGKHDRFVAVEVGDDKAAQEMEEIYKLFGGPSIE